MCSSQWGRVQQPAGVCSGHLGRAAPAAAGLGGGVSQLMGASQEGRLLAVTRQRRYHVCARQPSSLRLTVSQVDPEFRQHLPADCISAETTFKTPVGYWPTVYVYDACWTLGCELLYRCEHQNATQ